MFDDLKFAFRRLRRSPGFAIVAIVTLAFGIGANTAIFSIADAVLFRPLPYSDPDRVFTMTRLNRQTSGRSTQIVYEYLHAIADHHTGLGEVGIGEPGPNVVMQTAEGVERVSAYAVTSNYFQILGVRAARGRVFDPNDNDKVGRPAILSYEAWQNRFGANDGIVGRPLALGTQTFDIVGVLPADFVFPAAPFFTGKAELITVLPPIAHGARGGTFFPIVRLEPGVTKAQAQAEIDALIGPLALAAPRPSNDTLSLDDMKTNLYPAGRPIMGALLVAAGLVLLIGCSNLASMLLARCKKSERETGVRVALGASASRIIRPLLLEAAIIGVVAAALALAVTKATFDVLIAQVPAVAYGRASVGVDLRVVLFALALGLVSCAAFSVVPSIVAARQDVQTLIQARRGRPGRRLLGRPMVAVQVALAIVLVFGAAIATKTFLSVLQVPLGFNPQNVIVMSIRPPVGVTGPGVSDFYVRAMDSIRAKSGVVSVGAAWGGIPLNNSMWDDGVRAENEGRSPAGIAYVMPGYFETIGIPLVRGRLLTSDDLRGNPTASVVSESAARVLFPGRDPVGETFENGRGRQFIVVGVVGDVKKFLDRDLTPPAYALPETIGAMTLLIKTAGQQDAVLSSLKRQVGAMAPGVPLTADWWTNSIGRLTAYLNPRFQTLVLGTFAFLALGLTAIGVFGTIAFLVTIRTREIGVRAALGATSDSLVVLMMKQALIPVVVGVAGGVVMTRWLSALAQAQLFNVDTRDPRTLAIAAIIVVVVAAIASYLPARRASRVDPATVLSVE